MNKNPQRSAKMKPLAAAALVAAIAGLASAPAAAQSSTPGYNPSWYIAPGGHWFFPDDDFKQPKNKGGATIRLGKPLSESWDLQLGTTYSRAYDQGGSYRQNTLGADALYLFSRSNLRPFLLVGAGAQYDRSVRLGTRHSGTSPYANIGAGVQYFFTDQLGLQADYRLISAYVHPHDYGFRWANTRQANLGLIYVFEKPPAPVAAVEPPPAPMPVAAPPAPTPVPAPPPRMERITLSATELFAFDSARLRGDQPKLDEIATALQREGSQGGQVDITGYTDRLGSDAYNLRLSQHRADAVKAYLVSKGVPASRLNAVGKGETNPVVTCNDRNRAALIKCLEPNRRVEVEEIVITRPAS